MNLKHALVFGHRFASFDKQLHLANLVGEQGWHLDLSTGLLSFGNGYIWHVQILGTESDQDRTWLWAWANEGSNIPPSHLQAALRMKALGEEQQIPELTTPILQLGDIDGHRLAMIASGVCQANAYYRCPYESGSAFVLIQDERLPKPPEPPLARIALVFPQGISAIEIPDHRLARLGDLDFYGLA